MNYKFPPKIVTNPPHSRKIPRLTAAAEGLSRALIVILTEDHLARYFR